MRVARCPTSTIFSTTSHVTTRELPRGWSVASNKWPTLIAEQPYVGTVTRTSNVRRFPVSNYLIVYEFDRMK